MSNVILDFDGTVADTFPVVLDIFHRVSRRKVPLTSSEAKLLRGVALRQVKGRAMLRHAAQMHVPYWRIPFLFLVCRALLKRRMNDVLPMPGMHHVVRSLHEEGHSLYIMSANSRKNIENFLKHEHLHSYITDIYGDVRTGRKAAVLKRLLRRGVIGRHDTWCIGDEGRDIAAANLAGLRSIAVTWGYNSEAQLREQQPTKVVHEADQILTVMAR